MTKRVVAAAALIAAALAVSWVSLRCVEKTGRALLGYLEQAEELREKNGDYGKPLEQAEQLWRDKREMLGVVLKHSDADELEKYFCRIAACREAGETEQLFETVSECRAAVEVILRGEEPAARNIF